MRKSIYWCVLVLLVMTSISFLRCWDYGLINLDDYLYVTAKPEISEWAGWSTIRFAFSDVSESIWMPLTWLSYCLDWVIFGDWYGGFHVHSILIHAVNSCLVWQFLRMLFAEEMTDRRNLDICCLLGALIWAIHPLRCESVVFVASRKDVLSFFWELLALIVWVKGSRQEVNSKVTRYTFLAFACFVFGSCCKPSVMTFPVLCLVVDILIVRRVAVLRYPLPVVFMLFLGWFAAWQQGVSAVQEFSKEPMFDRLLDAAAAFGIYVRNTIWPQWLAPQCTKRWPELPRFLFPGIVISVIIWGVLLKFVLNLWNGRKKFFSVSMHRDFPVTIRLNGRRMYWLAGMSWFAVAITPMLGIANFGYHAFADRFTYIPALGISILVVGFLVCLKNSAWRVSVMASTGISVCLAFATWRQTGYWKDDLLLFSHTIEVDGNDNASAHGIIANWYYEFHHDLQNAVKHFKLAARNDISAIMGSFELFIMALNESGRADEIPEMMKLYENEVEKMYGPEIAAGILRGDRELNAKYGAIRSIYRGSKLAWWLADPPTYSLAGDMIKEIEAQPHLDNDLTWAYLKWKYYTLTGDCQKANALYSKLVSKKKNSGFTQFRFMRSKSSFFVEKFQGTQKGLKP